jgi:hypothetical protein
MRLAAIALIAWSLLGCSRGDLGSAPGGQSTEAPTASAENPSARSIDFLVESKPVKSLTVEEMKKRAQPLRVEVFEPYEQANVEFTAVALDRVLDEAYGPSW